FVGALFGTLKLGGVVVMVNPGLAPDDVAFLLETSRAKASIVHRDVAGVFRAAAAGAPTRCTTLVVGDEAFDRSLAEAPDAFDTFATHRDDPALWLFSGGTTGAPKAVVQTHRSFANTTECYAKRVIGY